MKRIIPMMIGGVCGALAAQASGAAAPEALQQSGMPDCSRQAAAAGAERPNILWLTFEDTSAGKFGCYGNPHVNTPNADSLAARGIQFMNAWSCGPQSSPARSSLITGCYATTYGMDVHPVPYDTPADIFFPQRLRDAGYYCTNNSKTHYNSTTPNRICWDECSKKASYNSPNRREDQPFFAVFNTVTSHMGRIRTFHTDGRRDYAQEGINLSELTLPDYVPDLPEMRSDYAGHLEAVQDVDTWLGFFLQDLKDKGLDDDTIVFFFSDHGGCIPRGKGYLYESGLRVPLLVYFPPKWQHLAEGMSGRSRDLVSFIDLGPTVLSLAGVKPTGNMQGRALFGEYASGEKRELQFAFAANHLHHFTPARAVTDGRYKLLRTYIPYRQFAMRNYYQWGMPGNKAWDRWALEGGATYAEGKTAAGDADAAVWAQPFSAHPAEMLFDLENDPGETRNLAGEPEYAETLATLRTALSGHIEGTVDLGFFLPTSRVGHTMYDKVREENYPLEELYRIAETAGVAALADLPVLEHFSEQDSDDMKFWAVVGYAHLARSGQLKTCPDGLLAMLEHENPYVAAEAAYTVSYLGHAAEGIARLIAKAAGSSEAAGSSASAASSSDPDTFEAQRKIYFSALECLSLDPDMRPAIMKYGLEALRYAAENLPREANEDAGLMARGILINLGQMDISDLHGDIYEEGLRLNRGRRPMLPRP